MTSYWKIGNHTLYCLSIRTGCNVSIFACVVVFMGVCLEKRRCCPDVEDLKPWRFEVESCHHFPPRVTNYSEPLFSHTQPLQSVNASPLSSQGRCLCTVLLCHRRLVPLGLCTVIPLSFLGAGPVFSRGSFLCEPAQPLSLSGCHTPSPHTPNTIALKCKNLKTKGPPASFEARCKASKSPRT